MNGEEETDNNSMTNKRQSSPLNKYRETEGINDSFSLLHTAGYSTIGVQEMNLATKYPYIYWACACLMTKSSSVDKEYNEGMDIENKESQSNTAKISSAIGQLQENGVNIANPNINTSQVGFIPEEENNRIIIGFKPISNINNEIAKEIINMINDGKGYDQIAKDLGLTKTEALIINQKNKFMLLF